MKKILENVLVLILMLFSIGLYLDSNSYSTISFFVTLIVTTIILYRRKSYT